MNSPSDTAIEQARKASQAGRIADAMDLLERASQAAPEDANILTQLGVTRLSSGRAKDAAQSLARALTINPDQHDARLHLGVALAMLGEIGPAIRTFTASLGHKETAARAAANLALIAERERRWADMRKYCLVWRDHDPANAQAWRSLSQAHWELGETREAISSYKQSFDCGGRSAAHLTSFGKICLYATEYAQAAEALLASDQLQPNNPDTLATLALLNTFRGDLETAESCAKRALSLNASEVSAFRVLVQLRGGHLSADQFNSLVLASRRRDLPANDLASLQFLLGDCLDARQEFSSAFAAYASANEFLRQSASPDARYERAGHARFVSELLNAPAAQNQPPDAPPADITPIFVIGMPRSGTTLIESVLAAHSQVLGGGERDEMRRIAWEYYSTPSFRDKIDATRLQRWRDDYLRALRPAARPFIVDKHPWNFDCVGLMLQVFPNAKIIHIRRNPIETGFSVYRNQFANFMTFTCSLEDIGHYYSQYARLAAYWEAQFPERIVTLQYEEFVGDFEASARLLFDACGLPWEDQCLEFWTAQRTISTITSVAARKPVSNNNGRAENYARHLGPLVSELKRGGVDLATGKFQE